MIEYPLAETAYKALKFAVQRLNAVFPQGTIDGGLEEHVEFRIIKLHFERELLYKIDHRLSDEIRDAIRDAIIEEAKELRIKVLTIQ